MTSHHRFLRHAVVLSWALSCAEPGLRAETVVERRVDTAPAPHLALDASAKPVLVHYVHLKDDYRDSALLDTMLNTYKKQSAACVMLRQRAHLPAHPPAVLPDQVLRQNEFEYAAPNRSIRYIVNYLVGAADDCSLIEIESAGATLTSSKGVCKIDLTKKTATGVCDVNGHADARPRAQPTRAQQAQTATALEADARMAERMAMIRQLSARSTPGQRSVAGYPCETIEGAPGNRICVSHAGSFVPTADTGFGVTLHRVFGTQTSTAVEAKFDMPVDPAVFTPYLEAGFTINGGAR